MKKMKMNTKVKVKKENMRKRMTLPKVLNQIYEKDHNTILNPWGNMRPLGGSQRAQNKIHTYLIPWLLVH
jgi:hypothetical protein